MAMPIGAIVGSLAAIYGNKKNQSNSKTNLINLNKFRELHTKRNLILNYLEKKFKCKKISIIEELDINDTIFKLDFDVYFIGIRLSNELIIEASIDYLYNYSYNLILGQLSKDKKEKYIKYIND